MIKLPAIVLAAAFSAVFWRRPIGPLPASWPETLPAFATVRPDFAQSSKASATVAFTTRDEPEAVLDAARRAFADAGWQLCPVGTRDFALFVRGSAVAAVLAEARPRDTRVTAILRNSGL